MSLKFVPDEPELSAKIKVIGIGGGGGNAVNRMIEYGLRNVSFIAANTDAQALRNSQAATKLQIGTTLTKGLGVGGDPEKGRKATEEDRQAVKDILQGADMVFITAGMGGGTGTGGAPVIAEVAKELGVLTVAVVTKPFDFEGSVRARQSEEGIEKLRQKVDTLLIIPNQKLFAVIDENTLALEAFKIADDVLRQSVQSIADIVTVPGIINVDFADVKSIMTNAGEALMGIGRGKGKGRAALAAEKAIESPLLDNVSIQGAKGILVNITGNTDITLFEINDAMAIINESKNREAHVFYGQVFDSSLEDEVKVTVIATGFPKKDEQEKKTEKEQGKVPLEQVNGLRTNRVIEVPTIIRQEKKDGKKWI